MHEETLKLTFDLTVEVEQPIWINKHADRENYIEHYSNRYKTILTTYYNIKTLLTLVSVTQIGSDTMPKVNLDGKRYRLCDVYKYFDVSDSTVRKRYKEGLRGPELIHGREYINMVQTYERNEKQLTAKRLYEIQQAEIRHERALKRKRREERIARAKRAEREVAKHRVNTRYFKNLVQNNLMVKVKTDQYGNVQRVAE